LSGQDRDLVGQEEDLAFLDACARASSPSQPKSWQKIRERSLSVMLAMIAGLHSPRRTAQVNAMDQGFGTDRLLRQGEAGED
jgi:hypothetical protein